MDAQPRLLQPTRLLDFTHPAIEALAQKRGWGQLPMYERIGAVCDFVRNEIAFGYNEGDELPAVFDSPDAFYARHGSNLSGFKRWLYQRVIRHGMNCNVARVRASRW